MTHQPAQSGKTCFVAMPITTPTVYAEKLGDPEHFAHVLAHLFVPALEEVGLTLIAPSVLGAEIVHAEIIRNLEQSDYVLCDLSSLNPNVLFELGIRTSLDRPTILVKDDLTEQTPFDINAINTLTYDSSLTPWSLANEKPRLVNHIKNSMNSSNTGNSMWRYFGLTKRAKPSEAGENPLEAKLDLLLNEVSRLQLAAATTDRDSPPTGSLEARLVPIIRDLPTWGFSFHPHGDNKVLLVIDTNSPERITNRVKNQLINEAAAMGFHLTIEVNQH